MEYYAPKSSEYLASIGMKVTRPSKKGLCANSNCSGNCPDIIHPY
ncbi:hypothetical protein [Azospirillum palustre]